MESDEKNQQTTNNQNPDGGGNSELDSQENNQQLTVESATPSCQIRMLSWKSHEKFLRFFQTTRRYKPVKKEYLACIGSSVTLQWQDIELERPNSTERETITGKLQCMKKESAGQYICCKAPGISDDITLSILQPREQHAFVNEDVTFDATNCTTTKEYTWSYMVSDNKEKDIIPYRRYVVVNNEYTRKLTIEGCRKKDNGVYICRDKKTDEQLTAYRLSILQPREQQAFVNDDVTFDATNCTTNKEYKWTYIDGDNKETDITDIPDRRYVVVNNKNTRKLTIKCYRQEDDGIYICMDKKTHKQLTAYRLSILQPREQQAFVKDDVTFDATNCTTNKEYKWTYMDGDNNKTDIIPDRRWVVVNNENTRTLTIKGCRKEDNDIYVCRDKETDEQLTAYRLKTKYNIKGNLTLNGSPDDNEFKQNLIKGTERLLTTPDHVVEIRISEGSKEDSPYQIPIVAYLTQERNETEFEELMNFDKKAVCVLFIAGHRSLPNIPLDREHVAIRFTKFSNTVKCSFYDDSQKDTWIKLLKEYTTETEGPDVADKKTGSSVDP